MAPSFTVLLVFTLAAAAPDGGPPAPRPDDRAAVAEALTGFAARDLNGRTWKAEDLRGRVVLIDFWATWCAPCLAEFPRLKALHAAIPRQAFEIVGVSLDVLSRRELISWLNRQRLDWPQIHERGGYAGATAQRFGIDRLPRTILLARDGSIAALDLRGEELERHIRHLVGAAEAYSELEEERR
jgi:thiol-disulfide isomerase/thioredoxin